MARIKQKNSNGSGSIRRRPDGKWEARYTDGYLPNGKAKRRSIYGTTEKEVRLKLNKIIFDKENGVYVKPDDLLFTEWLKTWLKTYARINIKLSTYTNYELYIRGHITPYFKKMKLQALKPEHLQEFFNYKTEHGRLDGKEGGISPKTIVNIKNMIHAALDQAKINGLVSLNVCEYTKSPKQTKGEMRVLTVDEQRAIINAAMSHEYGIPIITALYTGMRIGEILSLKKEDIELDIAEPVIHVRSSLGRRKKGGRISPDDEIVSDKPDNKTFLVRSSTKTYTSTRNIPIVGELNAHLRRQLDTVRGYKDYSEETYNERGFVFVNPMGEPFDQRTYIDIFNAILKESGVEKSTAVGTNDQSAGLHTLRHTFATRALESNVDILALSSILGHAQPSTTLNKYGHALPDHKRASMEKIEVLI